MQVNPTQTLFGVKHTTSWPHHGYGTNTTQIKQNNSRYGLAHHSACKVPTR